ncbi:hypothetical protein [Crenobacter caeni]|uniref:Uncharacterized protein n=1 Tax=Crenobacter caeni TaxID=2705474 RepID=A0A6B2KQH6_9NEIS|nr:hypothetical protein [Crenobacter caeni]NDV12492.1 hypothetical protein [Crenobacter caeni]
MTKYILGIALVAALVACGLLFRRWKRAKSRYYAEYIYPKSGADLSSDYDPAVEQFYRVNITRRFPSSGE